MALHNNLQIDFASAMLSFDCQNRYQCVLDKLAQHAIIANNNREYFAVVNATELSEHVVNDDAALTITLEPNLYRHFTTAMISIKEEVSKGFIACIPLGHNMPITMMVNGKYAINPSNRFMRKMSPIITPNDVDIILTPRRTFESNRSNAHTTFTEQVTRIVSNIFKSIRSQSNQAA